MTSNSNIPAGEFRSPTPAEIALVARWIRGQNRIKQSVLAEMAHVSEKSVERLEKGEPPLSPEIYRRLAEALGLPGAAFTEASYHPSLEDIRAAATAEQAKIDDEYTVVSVRRIQDARDFIAFFGAQGMLVDDTRVDASHLEIVYAFRDNLQDSCNIAGDVPDSSRLVYANELLEQLRMIERLGYAAQTIDTGVTTTNVGRMTVELGVLVLHKIDLGNPALPNEMWLPRAHRVP